MAQAREGLPFNPISPCHFFSANLDSESKYLRLDLGWIWAPIPNLILDIFRKFCVLKYTAIDKEPDPILTTTEVTLILDDKQQCSNNLQWAQCNSSRCPSSTTQNATTGVLSTARCPDWPGVDAESLP
jgi:hypothetical protein